MEAKLSASHIRYLLMLLSLEQEGAGVSCTELAGALGVKKPSVHGMMATLSAMDLIVRGPRGRAALTPEGRRQAERYRCYAEALHRYLGAVLPETAESREAVLALLSALPPECLGAMCGKIMEQFRAEPLREAAPA